MIYKKFQDLELSALGMGCMRFPTTEDGNIDIPATREIIEYAMANGINYYDTAWGYHGGESERVIGELLKAYPRESFYLADKFPGYDVSNMAKVREIFPEQLRKCQVDYFDFYLFHNLCELNVDGYLNPKYGIFDYLTEMKKEGKIRHLGFSAHGNLDTMTRFLKAYGADMEFCQLQINWLDWEFQNAKEKVELCRSYGIPVFVMEPVRGGSLASLSENYVALLRENRTEASAAEWAFRFIQSIPEAVVTLSGMSDFSQIKENIETFKTEKPLNAAERELIFRIGRAMTCKNTLPCTSCRYCVDHCPMSLDIPALIKLYNEHIYSGGGFIAPFALKAMEESDKPSACLGCGACEAVCPQNIKISQMMADFTEKIQ